MSTGKIAATDMQLDREVMRRRTELEPRLFRRHGAIILHRDDPDLTGMDRLLYDRLARTRFGA